MCLCVIIQLPSALTIIYIIYPVSPIYAGTANSLGLNDPLHTFAALYIYWYGTAALSINAYVHHCIRKSAHYTNLTGRIQSFVVRNITLTPLTALNNQELHPNYQSPSTSVVLQICRQPLPAPVRSPPVGVLLRVAQNQRKTSALPCVHACVCGRTLVLFTNISRICFHLHSIHLIPFFIVVAAITAYCRLQKASELRARTPALPHAIIALSAGSTCAPDLSPASDL